MNSMYNMNVGGGTGNVPPHATLPPSMAYGGALPNMPMGMNLGINGHATAAAYYNILPDEQPIFVNAKQYNRIIKRRETRKRQNGADTGGASTKPRKPYLHESRHLHAKNRKRGEGGRFLSKSERDALDRAGDDDPGQKL